LNGIFPTNEYPELLVGLDLPDDAAVYQVDETQAIISTVDFFPPVVDDPYDFGAIAAANALSDVYAMGGEPMMAINLAAFPDGLDMAILSEILRGGAETIRSAGAVIAGGHTVTDKEPKYGLAVTGMVHPAQIIKKSGAQPGDHLILTKPLGTGVVTTALKRGLVEAAHLAAAVTSMKRLNRAAMRGALSVGVRAMTDITGYSLVGHAYEMARASRCTLRLDYDRLRWLPGAVDYAASEIVPGGTGRNRVHFESQVVYRGEFNETDKSLLYDPQTSGGLLIAVEPSKSEQLLKALSDHEVARIGEVIPGDAGIIIKR
jgi:selenide, water dikinase